MRPASSGCCWKPVSSKNKKKKMRPSSWPESRRRRSLFRHLRRRKCWLCWHRFMLPADARPRQSGFGSRCLRRIRATCGSCWPCLGWPASSRISTRPPAMPRRSASRQTPKALRPKRPRRHSCSCRWRSPSRHGPKVRSSLQRRAASSIRPTICLSMRRMTAPIGSRHNSSSPILSVCVASPLPPSNDCRRR